MDTKPRILVIDTYYPEAIKALPVDPALNYEANLQKILAASFATADFYSRNLRALGWDAVDVIANHGKLQAWWASQYWERFIMDRELTGNAFATTGEILAQQIRHYNPDVMFYQDLSLAQHPGWNVNLDKRIMAGQLSCPWPGDKIVSCFDVIFTSFPHYVPRIEALGVRAIYNPLAFEPMVLERLSHLRERLDATMLGDNQPQYILGQWPERIHDVVFIGGVGNPSHWRYGMEVLETVAREIPTFKWWGYGAETLPANSALHRCYQGQAFGLDMYEILLQSKICLNRHGEVAEGYANNMRMFEATGCGAMLLTEDAKNLDDLFTDGEVTWYNCPQQAVEEIQHYLEHDAEREAIAANGQRRTLRDHTYARRMKTVSDSLMGMLERNTAVL